MTHDDRTGWPPDGICYTCERHLAEHGTVYPFPLLFDADNRLAGCARYRGVIAGSAPHFYAHQRQLRSIE